ncbi:MAG: class I SAM-dependent methyltransferase, partial [Solirubrobacteraceae bacterium]
MELSEEARRNREAWDRVAGDYQASHGEHIGREEPRWGLWQLPEDELGILGEVAGRDVLELGCGAAQWSVRLAARGARAVGLDNTGAQLEHPRRAVAEAGADVELGHPPA